jgi:hypothetical protein
MTNPADEVFYPNVSLDIPEAIKKEVEDAIKEEFGEDIVVNAMFLRQSSLGVYCPHPVHTDTLMGEWAVMLYLNREEDCRGGTSFVKHTETGLYDNPQTPEELSIWEKDYNNLDAWSIYDMAYMEPNTAVLFDGDLMHRAEPVGGFGDTNENSRLVLAVFFNEGET